MPETDRLNLPYPAVQDLTTVPAHMEALAEAVEQMMLFLHPLGVPEPFFGASDKVPDGFLIFNGQEVSRITYANLFEALGTTHGAGNGSTTFNLPDLRGRVPAGIDSGASRITANNQVGQSGGSQSHTLTAAQMPGHTHSTPNHTHPINLGTSGQSANHTHNLGWSAIGISFQAGSNSYQSVAQTGATNTGAQSNDHSHAINGHTDAGGASTTGSSGSGQSHNNLQPYTNCIWIGWSGNLPA